MTRTWRLLIGFVTLVTAAETRAQQPSPAVVKEIETIQNEWAKAYLTKDGKILERIMADEYVIFFADDASMGTKRKDIDGLKTSKTVFSSATNTLRDVRQYGDVVVARGEWNAQGSEGGKVFRSHDSWQTVFVKRNGKWVAVVSHEAPLPKSGK